MFDKEDYMEEIKKKVSCDSKGDVYGFIYQTPCIETEVDTYPEEWIEENLFYHNIPRFYVEGGVVKRRTDEECIAYNPVAYKEIKDRELRARFETETDSKMFKIIEKLAKKFEDEIPEVKEWIESKNNIRSGGK